jgi:O-antigen/teichoic acid export membrane protein
MKKRQILINASMSIGQFIVSGVTLFFLYKFLLHRLGAERFGIWSVVLATTSLVNVGNLGFSGCVVKYVAKYVAVEDNESVIDVIHISILALGVFIGMMLGVFYVFSGGLLGLVFTPNHLAEAMSILPYAMVSVWLSVIVGVFQGALDGYQRIDHSSLLVIGRGLINLLLCFLLVPGYGLNGLAYAYAIQSGIVLVATWLTLKKLLPSLPLIPGRWDRKLFREMLKYGFHFQVISISQMLYDPITKGLLARYGGLSMTGFYEMASRMMVHLRGLLIAANQVLVPTIAALRESNPGIIRKLYQDSYEALLYIALPYFSLIVALSPVVSRVWIGYYEPDFVFFFAILSIGWLINSMYAPSYIANLGIGDLNWNAVGHVIIAVLNLVLGILLGRTYGGKAVVVAWTISLVVGSLIILIWFHYKNEIPLAGLFPKEFFCIGLGSLVGLCLSVLMYRLLSDELSPFMLSMAILMTVAVTTGLPLWHHAMRRRLSGWLLDELIKKY